MIGKTKWFLVLALTFGTTVAATPARAPVIEAPAPTAAANSLDELFNALGVPFSSSEANWYKAVWTDSNGRALNMVFNARPLGTLGDGTTLTSIVLYVQVTSVPAGFNPSPALLKKVSDINTGLDMGSIVYMSEANSFFYQSAFWLNDATARTLNYQMLYASLMVPEIAEVLNPFVAG